MINPLLPYHKVPIFNSLFSIFFSFSFFSFQFFSIKRRDFKLIFELTLRSIEVESLALNTPRLLTQYISISTVFSLNGKLDLIKTPKILKEKKHELKEKWERRRGRKKKGEMTKESG